MQIYTCDGATHAPIDDLLKSYPNNCPTLPVLQKEGLQGCGKQPEKAGFSPCHCCLPELAKVAAAKKYAKSKTTRSKATIMRDEMMLISNECGMHLEFVRNTAFVTTVAGEWFFDPNIRPIKLHHKNVEKRYDRDGNSTGHYHIQDVTVKTPASALGYIFHHEQAEIKRLMTAEEYVDNVNE